MRRLVLLLVFSASMLLAQSGKKEDAPKRAEDTWERQKECLKFAEAHVQRAWTEQSRASAGFSWKAHYSPKYGHCYVRVIMANLTPEKNKDAAASGYIFLYDALENSTMAFGVHQEDADRLRMSCVIEERNNVSCNEVYPFIAEHMNN
jgi:hypothetical protein